MCNNPFFVVNVTPEFRARCFAVGYQLPRLKASSHGLYSQLFLSFEDYEFLLSLGFPQSIFTRLSCGKCFGCKSDYASQWQTRILLEAQQYDSNLFVTLTYDNEHINFNSVINPLTGETVEVNNLVYRDFQLFMKRLRKKFGNGIRMFVRGEYGDRTARTHFHCILFNLRLPDLLFKFRKNKADYFTSSVLEQLWTKGQCLVAKLDPASARYVASYSIKEKPVVHGLENDYKAAQVWSRSSFNPFDLVEIGELQPPMVRQSRRPGIARAYFEENQAKIKTYDKIPGARLNHLRYYDRLIKQSDPLLYAWFVNRRSAVARAQIRETSLSERDYLRQREERLRVRASKKDRDTFSSP